MTPPADQQLISENASRAADKRLPAWIRDEIRRHRGVHELKRLLRTNELHTVCEESRCPNQAKCFSRHRATFLILGDRCTRSCGFCGVTHAAPFAPDIDEPGRVGRVARQMGLRHVVITSVSRDDLPDGGALHFAQTVDEVRKHLPDCTIEVLIPDFLGNQTALEAVVNSRPDVINHNVETVERLYPVVRPEARYDRSLRLLQQIKRLSPGCRTKSGLMVGLGESEREVFFTLEQLLETGCDFLTIGQYLRPTRHNLEVAEYVRPEVFRRYEESAVRMGFLKVSSGPLVRSSMDAEEMLCA